MANPVMVEKLWEVVHDSFLASRLPAGIPDLWRADLSRLSDDQLRRGMAAVRDGEFERPPTLPALMKVCRQARGESQVFRNPVPVGKRPVDVQGKELPWWAYVPPRLNPLLTQGEISTLATMKARDFPDQSWMVAE